ncbi:MAG TPA: oligosaccharide flippase family protein [Bryobacteraceae bacterium]|nr:oligosaccharide flippase family protein [Bryobacteraceae bacterium]
MSAQTLPVSADITAAPNAIKCTPPIKSSSGILSRAGWVIGGYGMSSVIRMTSNAVLTRLLVPEMFGIMVVVNSVRYGVELLADLGIEQNVVTSKHGNEPLFANTAWTLQILRGVFLTLVFLCIASPLATFYRIDRGIMLAISLAPLANSLASTSIFGLVKNLDVKRRNLFELSSELLAFFATLTLAFLTRSVWALVLGALLSLSIRSALSFLLPHPAHGFTLHWPHVKEIARFGKWILLYSIVLYLSTNLDRIYLGKVAPLALLGMYGLARTISDLPATLASKVSYQLVFPLLAGARNRGDGEPAAEFAATRRKFVLAGAVLMATAISWADVAVRVVYDARYAQVGWMLASLLAVTWVSALSSLNEAVLLGLRQPVYNSVATGLKLFFVGLGVPAGYLLYGFPGAIGAIAAGELGRYFLVAIIQRRFRVSVIRQDGVATATMICAVIAWLICRHALSLGSPWDSAFSWGHAR